MIQPNPKSSLEEHLSEVEEFANLALRSEPSRQRYYLLANAVGSLVKAIRSHLSECDR